MHKKLQPAHADAARCSVFVHLDRIEVVAQEPPNVLENAILRLQKVNPGEQVQDKVAFHVVRLLEHVQPGVRLADRFPLHVSRRDPQDGHAPGEASRDHIYVARSWRRR